MSDDKNKIRFWAKTGASLELWHPLQLHMLDVAVAAEAILAREPGKTRQHMAEILDLPWDQALPWFLVIIASHDLGKACPAFQLKAWDKERIQSMGLKVRPNVNTKMNHGFASQIFLSDFLIEKGWNDSLADLVADAVGCHHGERAAPVNLESLRYDEKSLGGTDWQSARKEIFENLCVLFRAKSIPKKKTLSGPDFMLLSGLTSFADWIGSNEEWFSFGTSENCDHLSAWIQKRRPFAERALNIIGWLPREPLQREPRSFSDVFGKKYSPRPLQDAVAQVVSSVESPCILLIEAPMGEGKTEAAFYAHLEMQRRFGHRGLYIALPTKATGNAMFSRTLDFLQKFDENRQLDLQLLHGASSLNDTFQNLRFQGIHVEDGNGGIRAGEWFTHKKRALLSDYGVGTVDQALLTILPVRHYFVRLWGLANRVVVFDEIHAYDAYTGTLLIDLIRWLLALDSSVILLSATVPPAIRRFLAAAVRGTLSDVEASYPRVSVFQKGCPVEQKHFEADFRLRRKIKLAAVAPDIEMIQKNLKERLVSGGFALALLNTVQRAQDLYAVFPAGTPIVAHDVVVGKRLEDQTEVYLFHARYPADQRQVREDNALRIFGKDGIREGRKILIATQVAEQSLDLDFDFMISDLAPVDLILQRAGRLWRHLRENRPVPEPCLMVAGLDAETPPDFNEPLWWGAVYREDILLRTWFILKHRDPIKLPDDIDKLVNCVYEDAMDLPPSLRDRIDKAAMTEEGEIFAHKNMAHQAIIGFPEDASWNNPSVFAKADEDDPGLHSSLVARTRLDEGSVLAIPLFPKDRFEPLSVPDFQMAKSWFLRSMSLSRKGVVKRLQTIGVPEGWKKSALLRNCIPLLLDEAGYWVENPSVRLDGFLGLVYAKKEGL
ncbi:MAG: CRISPR-associated helicase Cas3' [Lentisphaeria bacterium]